MTAIGLIFAVLTERIRWSTAFKTVVFMPMAISLFAAGVIWRLMDTKDPARGTVNAAIKVVHDAFGPAGRPDDRAGRRRRRCAAARSKGFVLKTPRAGRAAPR